MTAAAATRWIDPGTGEWPSQLDQLAEPPRRLAVIGRPMRAALLRSVAIVGSRHATPLGRSIAEDWSAQLAAQGFTIVSGAAFGIDAAAHRGALRAGGHTVAVLASGADVDSPQGNGALLAAVRQRGTVISERPVGAVATRSGFLRRNRIIAALAPATLVVQAARRSGALNTARQAAQLHRVVMAVPGAVTDPMHVGCHDAIRDQFAILVGSPQEVLELLTPLTADGQASGSSTGR